MYAIARDGIAVRELDDERKDITPLLDFVMEHTPVAGRVAAFRRDDEISTTPALSEPSIVRMQPATLAYDSFLGRIAVGRVHEGVLKTNQSVTILAADGGKRQGKIAKLFTFKGMQRVPVGEVSAGDIVAVAGLSDIYVGETITTSAEAEALPAITVDPPSLKMNFMVNDSPFAGKEGKFVTSRHIRDRLEKELETNVGLQVEFSGEEACVMGRGEMHLAVLIENMRREGFELQVSQPEVVFQEIDSQTCEPIEHVVVNVPEEMSGKIVELMSLRKGQMTNMKSENAITQMEFEIPTRGLLGIRSNFIILTKGEGTMYSSFLRMDRHVGLIEKRQVGSMISGETGIATPYSLWKLQERGPLFIHGATDVYEGMIIGEHNQGTDLTVNPVKAKQLTNVRASGSDDAVVLTPPLIVTLEKALEYIKDDEYVEITPENIRLRKKWLTENDRKRNNKK